MKLSTRLTIAMVALVLVTIAVTGALTYGNLLSIAVPRSLERLGGHVQLLATELEAVVRGARADVLAFAVDEMVDGGSGDITDRSSIFAAVERRRLASRFSAELTAKPWYDRPAHHRHCRRRARNRSRESFGSGRRHPRGIRRRASAR